MSYTKRYPFKSVQARFGGPYGKAAFSRRQSRGNQMYRGGYYAFRSKASANAKASRALSLIRKFQNEEEVKLIDVEVDKGALASGIMQYQGVNYTVQGNTKTTRIGNKITMKSIAWKGYYGCSTAETGACAIRMMLVMDRNPGGSQATYSDFLKSQNAFALYNTQEANQGRFQILVDKCMQLNPDNKQFNPAKGYIDLKGTKVTYSYNNGTVADLSKNHLFWAIITDGNDQNCFFKFQNRVRFTDA